MVDGCVLLVDVAEGPMAQTKYVLSKALNMRLRPLVVLNKMDRDAATPHRCDVVHSMIFDLFASLGADDHQLDFPIIYASGALPTVRPDPLHTSNEHRWTRCRTVLTQGALACCSATLPPTASAVRTACAV